MRRMLAVVIAVWCVFNSSGEIQVMFAGIDKEKSPLFGQRYEQYVRERLNVATDVQPADWAETQRLVEKTGLRLFPNVSYSIVKSLQRFISDSTLLVWGRVENYTVAAKRRNIFGARVIGNVSIVITLYSLQNEQYVFVGNAQAGVEVRKPPVWFRRADLVTHISAQDREKIADALSQKTADRTMVVISAVVQSILAQAQEEEPEEKDVSEPSIYEIFQIPPPEQPPESLKVEVPKEPETPVDTAALPQESPPPADSIQIIEGLPPLPADGAQ